jgi:hypothetical protein
MHGKAFALYEESIHVPLYVKDLTGTFVPGSQTGTSRGGLTSHVDFVPLLMTLASGGDDWRKKPAYAHLARRANLAAMLSNPNAPGRPFILHTTDEDIPEEAPKVGIPYKNALISKILPPAPLPQLPSPSHAIAYRTKTAKLGVYSYFTPGSIAIEQTGQQAELYDYANYGIGEVTNNTPSGSAPEPALYNQLYTDLFNPNGGAVAAELRQPLPPSLGEVQRKAMADYLTYEASL